MTAFSGALGGFITSRLANDRSLGKTITAVFIGSCVAAFGAPLVCEYLDLMDKPNMLAAIGFFSGLISMELVKGLNRLIRKISSDPQGFWRKK